MSACDAFLRGGGMVGELCRRCQQPEAAHHAATHRSTPESRAAQPGPAAREVAVLMSEVRKAEDAARLEGLTRGFADCEALVIAMARAQGAVLEDGTLKVPGDHENAGLIASWALNSFALAVSSGQHRTDAYDPETLAQAHRRASTSPAMASAGGKARQAKLTPKQKSKLAKMAATARWKRAKKGE